MFQDDRRGSKHQGLVDFDRTASVNQEENQNLLVVEDEKVKKNILLSVLSADIH